MILLTHETPILLGIAPVDFRRGIDGFVALCKNTLAQEPRSGTVFVFRNRASTMIRALCYDGTGYWLMSKRISRGKFVHWPSGECALSVTSARELRLILSNSPWSGDDVSPGSTSRPSLACRAPSTTINHNAP